MISKFFLAIVLFIGIAGAVPIVPIANEYSGTVYINGGMAPQGTMVTASLGGIMLSYSSVVDQRGQYKLQVSGEVGQEIKFYINGYQADKTDSVSNDQNDTFDPYVKKYLDLSVTVSQKSNGDNSGGGGGGGGAPSDEDFKNIEKQESREVYVQKGSTIYKFITQDLIREIGFDAKISEGLVTAKIELLKARPKKATSDAQGRVFKYFNVVVGTSGYSSSSKLENAYIVFNVPDEWLKNDNARSVKLMKFKNNSWIDLKTEKISPGTYKAYSPGFSGFAIVGITEGSQEIVTILSSENTQATKEIAVPQEESKSSINLFLIIVVFIVMLLVSFAYLKRKELFKK